MTAADHGPPADALSRIRIVLHRPSHPGNIGSAARALKTMGLSRLALVAPRRPLDDQARALAAGGLGILEAASFHDSLEGALQGTALAVAFSARARALSHAGLDVRAAALEAVRVAADHQVALVFGNESAGLSNRDVLLCNRLAYIPSDPRHGSLNLAAAVQVAAYELRMAALAGGDADTLTGFADSCGRLASVEDLERLYAHLERSLRNTGFLDPGKPKRLMERLRRLYGRARLERAEINFLRGMLTAWDEAIAKAGESGRKQSGPKGRARKVD